MTIAGAYVSTLCRASRESSRRLALASAKEKNSVLEEMASDLMKDAGCILKENAKDVRAAKRAGLKPAMIDRLLLDRPRVRAMADSLREIASLKDPVGEMIGSNTRPNGLVIEKVRVPIGVILIIYESRPNVTVDCAGICLKSGNSVILRGGSDALRTNSALYAALAKASKERFGEGAVQLVEKADRAIVRRLLAESSMIDLVIPRGGESLIREVTRLSRIPVIKHYKGVCHLFVDRDCDLVMAERIAVNAKVQRPGVCNAIETLLVHADIAEKFLPHIAKRFKHEGVEVRGCERTRAIVKGKDIVPATEKDWYAEYLDLILSVRVVASLDEAIRHIATYGSQHSDAIVTDSYESAMKFTKEVDSACVYVNASTRFTDGGQFGMGAEIGISTDKVHARGPMGLEELTSYKYVILGNGQVRS